MNNKIYYEFEKNDRWWDEAIFYTVYIDENRIKRFFLRGLTGRIEIDEPYKGWGYKNLARLKIDVPLHEILEWGDITYGLECYKKSRNIYYQLDSFDYYEECDIDHFPEYAYEFANKMVKGNDNKGSKKLHLVELNEDTPCGNYFGIGII